MNASTLKRLGTLLLAWTMVVSAALCGAPAAHAAELPTITMEPTDIDNQLSFLASQIDSLKQNSSQNTWYYTVTDLDHDGSLEFVAASLHPLDRSTNLRVWEVSDDRKSLTECKLNKDPEESFPDIMTDAADTFHNKASDTWSYLFYDNIVISDAEVYTIKTAVDLKDGVISYTPYAIEHTELKDGQRTVTHTDNNGVAISGEQYNAAGINAFAGNDRSSTNFEWLKEEDLKEPTKLTNSFAVFMGTQAPVQSFPVPKPAALEGQPSATPAPTPAATAAPAPVVTPPPAQPVYLTVTKNPTNENRKEGDTAYFVSCANAYESLTWTFVSPDGGEYAVQNFGYMYPNADVNGQNSTTLSIANVTPDMSGWGAYCTFYYKGQTARTTTAYLSVAAKQNPKAPVGTYNATVTSWNYSSVTLNVEGRVTVTVPFGLCDIDGELVYGASATVYWDGNSVTYCHVYGNIQPQPEYGSMSGSASEGGGGYAIDLSNGSQVYVDGWKCNVSGSFYDGAPCVVYYTGYPSSDNIYSVDIYGEDKPILGPVYGNMSGYASEAGGGFFVTLSNGSEMYVDGWKCSVSGNFYDGAPCTVYYQNYPSPDNIYSVEITGSNDWTPPYTTYDDRINNLIASDVDVPLTINPYDNPLYDPIGDEHNRVTCPNCGNHFSMGYNACPVCGWAP